MEEKEEESNRIVLKRQNGVSQQKRLFQQANPNILNYITY